MKNLWLNKIYSTIWRNNLIYSLRYVSQTLNFCYEWTISMHLYYNQVIVVLIINLKINLKIAILKKAWFKVWCLTDENDSNFVLNLFSLVEINLSFYP